MNTKHNTDYMMLVSFGGQRGEADRSIVLYWVRRHLNMGTLAIIMFVTFAFISITRGNKAETAQVTPCRATSHEIGVDNFDLLSTAFITPGPHQNKLN